MGGTELMGIGLAQRLDPELLSKFQIIRSRVREIDSTKLPILWNHDLAGDPEAAHYSEHKGRAFPLNVFVSNWQKDAFIAQHGVIPSTTAVIKNAIVPIPDSMIKKEGKIKLIYHSTPHRGLDILMYVFAEKIAKENPGKYELHLYSSFKLYGWEQRDKEFQRLFDFADIHPDIFNHGTQPNDVVRKALAEADIFAYPSTWQETSCICAIEALSAKCLVVCPNYAALPETTGNFALMYDWSEDKQNHAERFRETLRFAIEIAEKRRTGRIGEHPMLQLSRRFDLQKDWTDMSYCWENIVPLWVGHLENVFTTYGHRLGNKVESVD